MNELPPEIEFLQVWYSWATYDAIEEHPFSRRFGLCENALLFDRSGAVNDRLKGMLFVDFGCAIFPFGQDAYNHHAVTRTMHRDPNRLAWVAQKLKQYDIIIPPPIPFSYHVESTPYRYDGGEF